MNRNRFLVIFAVISLLLLSAIPIAAQEAAPPPEAALDWANFVSELAQPVVMIALIFLVVRGFDVTGRSIPPEALGAFIDPVAKFYEASKANLRDRAAATASPLDDALLELGTIPSDMLFKELRKRGLVYDVEKAEGFNSQAAPLRE